MKMSFVWILLAAPLAAGAGCNKSRPHSSPRKIDGSTTTNIAPRRIAQPTPRPVRPQPPPVLTWPLNKVVLGTLPANLVPYKGRWKVSKDETTGKVIRTIEQSAKSANPVFNVLLVKGLQMVDGLIEARLLATSGKIDQGGGLVWRARDARNYYITRYNPLEDNLRLYTVKKGRRKQLASVRVKLPRGRWFTLYVTMKGDHIRVHLGGKRLLDIHDKTFAGPGRIGLWTKADARTHFADLRARKTN